MGTNVLSIYIFFAALQSFFSLLFFVSFFSKRTSSYSEIVSEIKVNTSAG